MRHFACLVAFSLALVAPAWADAQSASVSTVVGATEVEVGQAFALEVRVEVSNGRASDAQIPDLSAFDVLRQSVSQPMQFSFGFNGQQQMVRSSSVHSFVLRARTPGVVRLEPARIYLDGRLVEGNPVTITVRPGRGGSGVAEGNSNAPAGPSTRPPAGQLDGAAFDETAFLRTVIEPKDAVVGQQVTVTIYLYLRGALAAMPTITREPTTEGLWTYDLLPAQRTLDPMTQSIGSTTYRVYTLRRFAAFPLHAGEATVGAMSLRIPMSRGFDLFGATGPDLERTGVPVAIRASALPPRQNEGKPTHVGSLALEASLDRTQTATGDAVTLTLIASGTGQVDSLRFQTPEVPGLRFLAPQVRDEVSSSNDVVSGVRRTEWLLVAEREGTYRLPAFEVTTFDPATSSYGSVASRPLTLTAAGAAITSTPAPAGRASETEAPSEVDLGPIRTTSALRRIRSSWSEQGVLWPVVWTLPWLWLTLVLGRAVLLRARNRREGASVRVLREVKKRLEGAESALRAGDARAFYSALTVALRAVIEGRLGESIGSLTHSQLRRYLLERGMDQTFAHELESELEGIELARFSATAADATEMTRALDQARATISRLDRFQPAPAEKA